MTAGVGGKPLVVFIIVSLRFVLLLFRELGEAPEKVERSPKGNMWSAIPVALLCMIVN